MTQRELKFRVWDNGRKEWVHGPGNEVNLFGETIVFGEILRRPDDTSVSLDELNDLVALQYSGLKDKHGKEIYEGDIVRILYSDWPSKADSDPRTLDEYMRDIALIRIVIWSFNGFYVSISVDGYAESIEPGRHGYIEKIGDIYTTPELVDPKMIEHGNS